MKLATSRQYVKRIWRVPKDRGPAECLATLITKALVKHAWPASWRWCPLPGEPHAFEVVHKFQPDAPPDDFIEAVQIAVRVTARTYGVQVDSCKGFVNLLRPYRVVAGGHFKEL